MRRVKPSRRRNPWSSRPAPGDWTETRLYRDSERHLRVLDANGVRLRATIDRDQVHGGDVFDVAIWPPKGAFEHRLEVTFVRDPAGVLHWEEGRLDKRPIRGVSLAVFVDIHMPQILQLLAWHDTPGDRREEVWWPEIESPAWTVRANPATLPLPAELAVRDPDGVRGAYRDESEESLRQVEIGLAQIEDYGLVPVRDARKAVELSKALRHVVRYYARARAALQLGAMATARAPSKVAARAAARLAAVQKRSGMVAAPATPAALRTMREQGARLAQGYAGAAVARQWQHPLADFDDRAFYARIRKMRADVEQIRRKLRAGDAWVGVDLDGLRLDLEAMVRAMGMPTAARGLYYADSSHLDVARERDAFYRAYPEAAARAKSPARANPRPAPPVEEFVEQIPNGVRLNWVTPDVTEDGEPCGHGWRLAYAQWPNEPYARGTLENTGYLPSDTPGQWDPYLFSVAVSFLRHPGGRIDVSPYFRGPVGEYVRAEQMLHRLMELGLVS